MGKAVIKNAATQLFIFKAEAVNFDEKDYLVQNLESIYIINCKPINIPSLCTLIQENASTLQAISLINCELNNGALIKIFSTLTSVEMNLVALEINAENTNGFPVHSLLPVLKKYTSLVRVCLIEFYFQPAAIILLFDELKKNTSLAELDLSQNFFDIESLIMLNGIIENSKLESLILRDCIKHSDNLNVNLQALKANNNKYKFLKYLDISESELNKLRSIWLTHIIENSLLQSVILKNSTIRNDADIKAIIASLKKNNSIEHIDMSGCKHSDIEKYFSDFLLTNNTLKKLKLSFCGISKNGVRQIINALKHNTILEYLDLSDNKTLRRAVELKKIDLVSEFEQVFLINTTLNALHIGNAYIETAEDQIKFINLIDRRNFIEIGLDLNEDAANKSLLALAKLLSTNTSLRTVQVIAYDFKISYVPTYLQALTDNTTLTRFTLIIPYRDPSSEPDLALSRQFPGELNTVVKLNKNSVYKIKYIRELAKKYKCTIKTPVPSLKDISFFQITKELQEEEPRIKEEDLMKLSNELKEEYYDYLITSKYAS